MAQNEVGKISIGIEAKVDSLAADMRQAEQVVSSGATNIEKRVDSLAMNIQRSWMEAFSKISVMIQLAETIEKAFSTVSSIIGNLGDESLNASQKITKSLDDINKANIPVVSSMVSLGEKIGDLLDNAPDWAQWLEPVRAGILWFGGEIENIDSGLNTLQLKQAKEYSKQQALLDKLSKTRRDDIALQEHLNSKTEALTNEERVLLQVGWERKKMQDELAATVDKEDGSNVKKTDELVALNKKLTAAAEDGYTLRLDAARKADEAEKQSALDKATAIATAAEREAQAIQKAKDKEASARIKKTKDLNSLVLQGELTLQGKLEKAEKERIRRSFELRRESATTDKQLGLLVTLERMEMGAVGDGGGGGGGGGTTSIATAIGTFSMGTGSPELKESEKQTELQTAMLAALQKNDSGGVGVVLAT